MFNFICVFLDPDMSEVNIIYSLSKQDHLAYGNVMLFMSTGPIDVLILFTDFISKIGFILNHNYFQLLFDNLD